MEEVLMEATEKCMLKQFTADKPAEAVAGDVLVMQSATKRKAVAGSSNEEGFQTSEGWIDDVVGADMTSFDPAVIDEMLQEAKLPAAVDEGAAHASSAAAAAAAGGRGGKHRLSRADIITILALKPRPIPPTDDLDDLTDIFSPEYIKERKQQLEADEELFRKSDEESEVFRQRLIKSVRENGYFEVDDQFLINREKANQMALEQLPEKDLRGVLFLTKEEGAEMEAALLHFLDDEDAAVLEFLRSDDKEDDLSVDEEEAQGRDEAQGHKVAAAIEAN
jgi:hypothetical protein